MSQSPNIFDPNQIVEPGRSDKAAFDREAYMRAMRGGDVSGGWSISLVIGLFFAGFFLAATLAISLGADFPQRYGFFTGLGLAVAVPAYRVWKAGYDKTKSIDLQAQAHDLELKAKQLEVELAKNSGAFDKWDKSQ